MNPSLWSRHHGNHTQAANGRKAFYICNLRFASVTYIRPAFGRPIRIVNMCFCKSRLLRCSHTLSKQRLVPEIIVSRHQIKSNKRKRWGQRMQKGREEFRKSLDLPNYPIHAFQNILKGPCSIDSQSIHEGKSQHIKKIISFPKRMSIKFTIHTL